MAELGAVASVIQIADTGLRLSIKLCTFGELIADADKSVISISKDVSLTSSVLKELGEVLDKDGETQKLTPTAIGTADTVVKECLDVFQEMETMLVKKLPHLHVHDANKASKATKLLERLKWPYLQPKLRLLQSHLDKLKSTILLMLNVIMYARQIRSHTPYRRSVRDMPDHPMTDQVSLIEGLAHSNKEKIGAFENLKLGTDINLFALQNNSEEEAKESALTEYDDDPQESGFRDNPRPIQLRHCLMMFTAMLNENDKVKYYMMPSSRSRVREGLHDMFNNEMDVLGKVVGNPLQEPIRAYFAALVTASKYKFSSKTPMELASSCQNSPLATNYSRISNSNSIYAAPRAEVLHRVQPTSIMESTPSQMGPDKRTPTLNSDDTVDPSKIGTSPTSKRESDSNQSSSTINPELKEQTSRYTSLYQASSSSRDPNDGGAGIGVGHGTGQPSAHISSADALNQFTSFPVTASFPSASRGYPPESAADPFLIEGPPSSPQCWDHGCNGRQFTTFGNLMRHQREKVDSSAKSVCPRCGAAFTRKTARDGHLAHGKCEQILPVVDSPVDSLRYPAKKRHRNEESEDVVLIPTSNDKTDNETMPKSRSEASRPLPLSMGRTSQPMRIPDSMQYEWKLMEPPHTMYPSNSQVVDELMALWITPSY